MYNLWSGVNSEDEERPQVYGGMIMLLWIAVVLMITGLSMIQGGSNDNR